MIILICVLNFVKRQIHIFPVINLVLDNFVDLFNNHVWENRIKLNFKRFVSYI